jgi:putative endonuclease
MFYVYVIWSLSGKFTYPGITQGLKDRLKRHAEGRNLATRRFRPFKLLFTEQFETRALARSREKYLKSGAGSEFIRKKYPLLRVPTEAAHRKER